MVLTSATAVGSSIGNFEVKSKKSGSTLENHCHSTQSAAASRNATLNCIMQRGRHLLILRRNAAGFSGPEVI